MSERTKTKLILKAVSHSIHFFTHHRDQQVNVFVELYTAVQSQKGRICLLYCQADTAFNFAEKYNRA